ncbi:hypothetical protein A8A01_03025 [Ewingella americana]|nr:hypothetical protein A8A01_03025 [Ewingella americana]
MKKILIAILVIGLVGCSSNAVQPNQAQDVPSNQALKHQHPFEKSVQLIVVRDAMTLASPCLATVYVNKEASAKLSAGQKATLYLPAGDVTLGAGLEGDGLCKASRPVQERDFILREGGPKAIRIFFDRSGYADLKPF